MNNKEIETFQISELDTQHIMTFQVKTQKIDLHIVNVYCQASKDIQPFLKEIKKILALLRNRKVIITMDTNAHSRLWHSKHTDDRGRELEEFIGEQNLHVIKKPDQAPTFFNSRGQSNIDVTIVTINMLNHISKWNVTPNCEISDHNLITFMIDEPSTTREYPSPSKGYNLRRASQKTIQLSEE